MPHIRHVRAQLMETWEAYHAQRGLDVSPSQHAERAEERWRPMVEALQRACASRSYATIGCVSGDVALSAAHIHRDGAADQLLIILCGPADEVALAQGALEAADARLTLARGHGRMSGDCHSGLTMLTWSLPRRSARRRTSRKEHPLCAS